MSSVSSSEVSKLQFKVIGCTSWEDSYHPKSVEELNPFVKGWRSERYCLYPQQIVLSLKGPVRLRKIQLLSHEYMISSKIELFVANSSSSNSIHETNHLNTIPYTRLGYVSMSENSNTDYKSREMKSINVDAQGHYLKLVFHTNHVNQLNLYSQVSVLALNLLGLVSSHSQQFNVARNSVPHVQQSQVHMSTTNDLSFDMTLDPSSAKIVKELEQRKAMAIEEDRFELAKLLKKAITDMTKTGKILCHYEKEKRQAIVHEDFDEAKKWKVQKDKLMNEMYKKLDIHLLLNGQMPVRSDQQSLHVPPTDNNTLPPISSKPSKPQLQQVNSSTTEHHHTSEGQIPTNNSRTIDPRGLPTNSSKTGQPMSEYPTEQDQGVTCEPEPLSDTHLNEAAIAVQVLGTYTVSKVFSKQYNLREQGLTDVLVILKEGSSTFSKSEMTKSTCQILKRGLTDKVLTSFMIALDILRVLVGPYAKQHQLSEGDLISILDKVLPVLMNRLGDTNARIQSTAEKAILDLSVAEELKSLIGHYMLRPLAHDKIKNLEDGTKVTLSMESQARTVNWRYAKGRVKLLQNFLQTVDLDTARMNIPHVMEFVNVCLQHVHAKVREEAAQLTIELYKQYNGMAIRKLLPVNSSDHIAMKNIFWRSLFEQFDEIDGNTVSDQDSFENARRTKQKKIDNLKGQLDVLRDLNDQRIKQQQQDQSVITERPTMTSNDQIPTDNSNTTSSNIDSSVLDHTCPFCKENNPELSGNQMDAHFAANCPMLSQCKRCEQMIEIKSMGMHMLNECREKAEMTECSKCHEVLLKTQLESHMKGSRCTAPPENYVKCLLCHTNVQNSDEGWFNHLTSISSGCAKNPRRKRRRGQQQQQLPSIDTSSVDDRHSSTTEGASVIPR